ncbi:unnamed protein product, partial [marine sediment metagenome]
KSSCDVGVIEDVGGSFAPLPAHDVISLDINEIKKDIVHLHHFEMTVEGYDIIG